MSGAVESVAAFSSSFVSFGYQLSLGWRTRRSSEREPADTPSGDTAVVGCWLPSLTFHVRPTKACRLSGQTKL